MDTSPEDCFAGGGEMGALMRSLDWSASPLGPVSGWPQSLRTSVSICLNSGFAILIWWGPELVMLYNDAYRIILGKTKHPKAMGQPGLPIWTEIKDVIGPMLAQVRDTGQATYVDDLRLIVERNGFAEESYFTFSYSPIRDESGGVGGVFSTVIETTQRVLGERRLRTLRDLGARARETRGAEQAAADASGILGKSRADLPFSLVYLLDPATRVAHLAGAAGLEPAADAALAHIDLAEDRAAWPLGRVAETGLPSQVHGLDRLGVTCDTQAVTEARVLPIERPGQELPYGFLVAGISPRLSLDDAYCDFLDLVADSLATTIANARAYEEERRRVEELAALDRAKTDFFSNVSHELRTPLTLLLGPAEDALADKGALAPADRERWELVHRNGLRLAKLVNSLLDFSRIEAGRIEASYLPTDLATLTRELASMFHSAVERAGLRLDLDGIEPIEGPAYVDRDMWEKIVLNLLSNALKFTFKGTIAVSLRAVGDEIELAVADTGIGIAPEEIPRLFERFHRVRDARSRTHEGTGIGLALVQELAGLHGGRVRVTSAPGQGSTFVVTIRRGSAHLPPDRIGARSSLPSTSLGAAAFLEEARSLLQEDLAAEGRGAPSSLPRGVRRADVAPAHKATGRRAQVLLADDNADMRAYVTRILERRFDVEAVGDGASALEAARKRRPDLLLSDVMMPGLDGFALVRALRADPSTRDLPIVLLSARAGEDSAAEGLESGADDYLVKPFSARELLARINTHIELAHVRAEAQSQRTRLLTLIEQAPALITILRGPDHVIEMASAQYERLFGGRAIVGKPLREAMPELVGQSFLPDLDRVLETGESFRYDAVPSQIKTGSGRVEERFFSFIFEPILSAAGEVDGVLTFGYEVTEQVRARRAAEAANRAKDEFLAMLGHELRNPLAPIVTALHLMEQRSQEGSRGEREVIERQVRHLVQLVDDLLDVSRITRGKIELRKVELDIADVIDTAVEMASPLFERRAHVLTVEVPKGELFVRGDRARLAQLASNLLTNAAKYTESGGRISVMARREGDEVVLRVRDTGMGIAAELMPRVFDLFEQGARTLDRSEGGLGLGLAIVKSVATMHDGSVSVASEGPGKGSEFTVRLPALRGVREGASAATTPPAPPAVKAAPAGERRILLVDDNADAVEMLEMALDTLGYKTRVAYDGPAALEAALAFKPDIAVLDIGLPVMDGYELARRLRALPELGNLRLIAVTGYGQQTDRARSHEAGFDHHLVKPIELASLLAVLDG